MLRGAVYPNWLTTRKLSSSEVLKEKKREKEQKKIGLQAQISIRSASNTHRHYVGYGTRRMWVGIGLRNL